MITMAVKTIIIATAIINTLFIMNIMNLEEYQNLEVDILTI